MNLISHHLIKTLAPQRGEGLRERGFADSTSLYGQPSSRFTNRAVRVVIQRVSTARVVIEGVVKGSIDHGLLVLAAVEEADTPDDVAWISGKIARLRVFNDQEGVMNRSVQEVQGGVLLISQFTLFASTRKGNRPSYSRSARPELAIPIYEALISQLKADLGQPIQTGEFGADMKVSLTNDGPVTIIIDSRARE